MGGRSLQMSLVKVSSFPKHCFLFTVLVVRGLGDLLWAQFYVILNKEPIYPYDKSFCVSLRIPASGINGKNRTVFCHLFKRMEAPGKLLTIKYFSSGKKTKEYRTGCQKWIDCSYYKVNMSFYSLNFLWNPGSETTKKNGIVSQRDSEHEQKANK